MGERIRKVTSVTERYAYNENDQLLAEYGATNRDYLWLDDLPVAVVDNTVNGSVTTSTINYVTADQLNTPRAVGNSAGTTIWSWSYKGNPFGEQQPTSSSGYVLNLRYPGQYADQESGLVSNGFRDCYEPATGRYCESDPTGLDGGISTYAYVGNNPLMYSDSLGLESAQYSIGQIPDGRSYRTPCESNALLKLEANLTPPGAALDFLKDVTGAEVDFEEGIPSLSFGNYGSDTSAAVGGYAADGMATGMFDGHIANMAQRAADSSISYQLRNAARNRMEQSIAKSATLSGFGKVLGPAAAFYTFYQDVKKCGCEK